MIYYESINAGDDYFRGRLFDGDTDKTIHKTNEMDTEGEAIDAITDWAEENGYDDIELA